MTVVAQPDFEAPRFNTVCFSDPVYHYLLVQLFACRLFRSLADIPGANQGLDTLVGAKAAESFKNHRWSRTIIRNDALSNLFTHWYATVHPLVNDMCGLYTKARLAQYRRTTGVGNNPGLLIALTAPECFHLRFEINIVDDLKRARQPSRLIMFGQVIEALGSYQNPRGHLPDAELSNEAGIDIRLIKLKKTLIESIVPDALGPDGTLSLAV